VLSKELGGGSGRSEEAVVAQRRHWSLGGGSGRSDEAVRRRSRLDLMTRTKGIKIVVCKGVK
jgi:hypothetical protein